ncbi:conserved hypothetical protein [Ricinus communis]|uniref:Uncharacterized protein n=1 Tax=Ricinus communis TaxID=3988 RepID=B9TPR9_RICCO|nr:conserved hypothetical protein [Ricinus communis]
MTGVVDGQQGFLHHILDVILQMNQALAQKRAQATAQFGKEVPVGHCVAIETGQQQGAQALFGRVRGLAGQTRQVVRQGRAASGQQITNEAATGRTRRQPPSAAPLPVHTRRPRTAAPSPRNKVNRLARPARPPPARRPPQLRAIAWGPARAGTTA